jgi:poly(3-hydroxybutyrate) depolymerase
MMVNRVWCESPNTFDGYVTFAGPPAPALSGCAPSTIKPYMGLVGDSDEVLQTSGNMAAAQWTIKPILVASEPSAWVAMSPKVLNEKVFFSTRVHTACGETVGSGTVSGSITTWSNCSNSIKLQVISGGDHCIGSASFPCSTILMGTSGVDPKTAAMDFLKNF